MEALLGYYKFPTHSVAPGSTFRRSIIVVHPRRCLLLFPEASSIPGFSAIRGIGFCQSSNSSSTEKSRSQIGSKRRSAVHAQRKNSEPASKPIQKSTIVDDLLTEEEDNDEEEQLMLDEFDGEDDDYFEDEFLDDETEVYVGDGGGGGGIKLAGTWWDRTALEMAEEVCRSFDGDLSIYAFKTLLNSTIQVRIERLTNKSGSPSMEDIEAFSTTYRKVLDKAELTKSIPDNVSLEVSSPGVERVVRIPQDLDRFKERAMYVKYLSEVEAEAGSLPVEKEGIFRLVTIDMNARNCTWGMANVRVNREKAGKGRPLSKKQREWRLQTGFDSLRLVRIYSDC